MNNQLRRTIRLLVVIIAAGATLTATANAQSRRRLVSRASQEAATLSGVVLDAATRVPLAEVEVVVGGRRDVTDATGQFSFTGLTANSFRVAASRWGYLDYDHIFPLVPGANQIEVLMQQTSTVTLRLKNGSVVNLDSHTVEFGYNVAFVGWTGGPRLRICQPDGTEVTVLREEMKSVVPGATRTEATDCCSLLPGRIVQVTRTDGSVVTGTIRETCTTNQSYNVRARDRNNVKVEKSLADVAELVFN